MENILNPFENDDEYRKQLTDELEKMSYDKKLPFLAYGATNYARTYIDAGEVQSFINIYPVEYYYSRYKKGNHLDEYTPEILQSNVDFASNVAERAGKTLDDFIKSQLDYVNEIRTEANQ